MSRGLTGTDLVAETDHVTGALGRKTDMPHAKGRTTFADYDLVWDKAGRVTDFDIASLVGDDGTADYVYDDTDQLTAARY